MKRTGMETTKTTTTTTKIDPRGSRADELRARVARWGGESFGGPVPIKGYQPSDRVALVWDGAQWHARRIADVRRNLDTDEMVYRCDLPIVNNAGTIEDLMEALEEADGDEDEWETITL